MNIKEYLGFAEYRELVDYIITTIIMILAILCLSYLARIHYMTTIEYIIFVVEMLMTGIIGYRMMINVEYHIFIKTALICFPLSLHMEWILIHDCFYFGLAVFILLLFYILYYIVKCEKYGSIINHMIKIMVMATIVLSLAVPFEAIIFINSFFTTSNTITINDELETVMLLCNDEWQTLTLNEKLNVLKIIEQIELNELGINDIPTLRYDALPDIVLGEYIDINNTIVIDKTFLNEREPLEIVETVIHECRHKYQYSVVADNDFEDNNYVMLVSEAIDNYVAYSEDKDAYFQNYLEIDADNYADMRIIIYEKILT